MFPWPNLLYPLRILKLSKRYEEDLAQMRADLLGDGNKLAIKPSAYYDQFTEEGRRMFCHYHARYLLPTTELIAFLEPWVKGRVAIEIGAGSGDLGRELGIPMYDNFSQEVPEVRDYYRLTGQPTSVYGTDVKKMPANKAVRSVKPEVVIGAWVTQKGSHPSKNAYGIDEMNIVKSVDTYILIGAEEIHGDKKIMKLHHTVTDAPFVRSPRLDNKIWIWSKYNE